MVSHPGLSFDQGGHSLGGPQERAKALALRPCFKNAFQLDEVVATQAGFAADPSGFLQSLGTAGLPGFEPAAGRLPVDAEFAGHLSLAYALVKEFDGFEPPPFQLGQLFCIAFNAFGISHTQSIAQK
jgi:hypothetical protein